MKWDWLRGQNMNSTLTQRFSPAQQDSVDWDIKLIEVAEKKCWVNK